MDIQVYHGSANKIVVPRFGAGKKNNDYGRGFYVTKDIDLAREWAVDLDRNGYVNAYTIEMENVMVLNLMEKPYCPLHWLEILLENRTFDLNSPVAIEASRYLYENFHIDTDSYDIIYGYRADDSYFTFARDFLNNTISYRQLTEALRYGQLGTQYMLKSRKAFESIRFTGCEYVSADEWYIRKQRRDYQARKDYYDTDKQKYHKGDLYMTRILDEEVTAGDVRLR